MEESVLVNKAEKYLKEISNDSISLNNIDDFDNFKSLYFKLDDRLNHLQNLKDDMDAQGYTTPFTSLSRYGTKSVAEVTLDEVGENSRHNQIFRMKANAKKNILDRVKSAIDSHKIALGHLKQFGYVKCNSCYKKYSIDEYKKNKAQCSCGCKSFTFKINKETTHRIEIIPFLPLSGNYMVLMSQFSNYGREALKKVLSILKQERKGVVKTISLVIRFKDENNRLVRKNITMDSEYVNNYEEEVRKRYGPRVRIEALRFHRTKPAIIDDKHARTALAIAYVRYCEQIILNIKDDILKRRLSDFKRIKNYDETIHEFENQTPDFIDKYDVDAIEAWRESKINEKLRNYNYLDRFGNMIRPLKRDLKVRDNIYKNSFVNIASALIMWDIFRYYLTTSNNSRKIESGPFPYIRVELDREQRKVFQTTYTKVIDILNDFTDIKIIPVYEMDLLLYEKFKFEKQIKNSNIKFNHVALGAGLIHENSDIELEDISNAFNINESKIKKEIKNINHIKNPKSDKSKKFLDLIKK
ncbi:DUF530 domain-containing protein [Methanobrevibacter sp.]|uniref:DUF530 domain-containing protein n=1 Tax=Methanobrevibacter sp. TaxID=66852 RepID=UPI0026E04B54|nr:DUF530 domain-containing protein [Methanobrevibacter sp.]MDO5859796.1 DUF530 domain-containing protein [Methanobrevibacter sp.]